MSWMTRKQKVTADALQAEMVAALEAEHPKATAAQIEQQGAALVAAENLIDGLVPGGGAAEFTVVLSGHAAGEEPAIGDSVTVTIERTA